MIKEQVNVGNAVTTLRNPAAELVSQACAFSSDISFETENTKINAKSIMGMMTFVPQNGDIITICVNGADEQEAAFAIKNYLEK